MNQPRLATSPTYTMSEPNAAIDLYVGKIRLTRPNVAGAVEAVGTVLLRWLPTPRIELALPSIVGLLPTDECRVELIDKGVSCVAGITSMGKGGLKGQVDQLSIQAPRVKVKRMRYHVPNFLAARGAPLTTGRGDCYAGRHQVDLGEWRLTLDMIGGDVHDRLREAGGYIFTHVLTYERIDGSDFDPADLKATVHTVDRALSFLLGRWTGSLLGAGYDANEALVCEDWRFAWLMPFSHNSTWAPIYEAGVIEKVLSSFVSAMSGDKTVAHALNLCLHWHVEANVNHGGLEGAITMMLIALEMLAWLELVNKGDEDPDAFSAEAAHIKIRRYLARRGIPVALPVEHDAPLLAAFITDENLADGVEALTRIRNRTVHPPRREFVKFHIDLREQASRMGLHLLERALLAELGYQGHLHYRLRAGWPTIVVP